MNDPLLDSLMRTADEVLAPIAEAVDGYQAQCRARGYSTAAAEDMAVHYHAVLFAHIETNIRKAGQAG